MMVKRNSYKKNLCGSANYYFALSYVHVVNFDFIYDYNGLHRNTNF